jgi:hypothetical protein
MSRYLLIPFIVLALAAMLLADVPRTISYQGRLTDNGVPVNGLKSVRFKIYDRSSNPIWNSGTVNVNFADGLFTVELGQSPQTPLPSEIWPSDTAMTLGVTISPNPELSPRLHFKTVPYAMHALTVESAASAGGWVRNNGFLRLENPNDSIGIGTTTPEAKVGVSTLGEQSALRIRSTTTSPFSPAFEVISDATTAGVLRIGPSGEFQVDPLPALECISNGVSRTAGLFKSYNNEWPTITAISDGPGDAIRASSLNYSLDIWNGKGIRAAVDSATAIRAESNCSDHLATVISSVYTGTIVNDHVAVSGYSRPADFYGVGGRFEGGYKGVEGVVKPEGYSDYTGVVGSVTGGTGSNFGVSGYASGQGSNIGIHGYAEGGSTNWAGYFGGDVNVTGNIVKSASTLAIDHPTAPDDRYLQQAEVVSDNLSAVYSGNVTLGGDGSAVVQLPDYLESFCGDFRYQLTCVGGYAPVYVSSKIADSKFAIAGGTSGLEVSWQITGIRKDKYAQANPLEVEKKKTASEQGKYLHPELYGFGDDRSLSPNPERDASVKGKNDAIRAATAALTKPSTPPKQPVMMEKN